MTLVAAGHASKDSSCLVIPHDEDTDKPRTILKVLDEKEVEVYRSLATAHSDDPLQEFIPDFQGVVEECDQDGEARRFIRIENLLRDFDHPMVMDVKLGCRTFLESEVNVQKPRPDLFQRMLMRYPQELTEAERQAGSITKHRWMSTHDAQSTTASLAFRIDGVAGRIIGEQCDPARLTALRTLDDTTRSFAEFVENAAIDFVEEEDNGFARVDPKRLAEDIELNLRRLRDAMEESNFVASHEFIGSSVLIVADATGRTGAFWIDFAKTSPAKLDLTHRDPWKRGNHEDGVLTGIESMIDSWSQVVQGFCPPDEGNGFKGMSGKESSFVSSMFVEVGQWRKKQPNKRNPLGLLSAVLHPFWKRPPRRSRRETTMGREQCDLSLLSSLPVFDGRVADTPSRVWGGGFSGASVRERTQSPMPPKREDVSSWEEEPLTCL